ncbi:protein-tyrosine phosphatase-like protein [Cladochytrium replicatum]|nr:protein-tyrosine phosphatase-like protein [Cladochytrium replicatum]
MSAETIFIPWPSVALVSRFMLKGDPATKMNLSEKIIASDSDKLILIEIRSGIEFAARRLRSAVQVIVPGNLLRRSKSGLERVFKSPLLTLTGEEKPIHEDTHRKYPPPGRAIRLGCDAWKAGFVVLRQIILSNLRASMRQASEKNVLTVIYRAKLTRVAGQNKLSNTNIHALRYSTLKHHRGELWRFADKQDDTQPSTKVFEGFGAKRCGYLHNAFLEIPEPMKTLGSDEQSRIQLSFRAKVATDAFSTSCGINAEGKTATQTFCLSTTTGYNSEPRYLETTLMHPGSLPPETAGDKAVDCIAAQRLMPSTIGDFWRMCWDHHAGLILLLCPDDGKLCPTYWPSRLGSEMRIPGKCCGDVVIRLEDEKTFSDGEIVLRKIILESSGSTRLRNHIHFLGWPDHGIPIDGSIVPLMSLFNDMKSSVLGPVVVHCSAGCGRTGTFLAIEAVVRTLKADHAEMNEDWIYRAVQGLRTQRAAGNEWQSNHLPVDFYDE